MSDDRPSDSKSGSHQERQSSIDEIVFDHVQSLMDGEEASVAELVARHPDLMPDLEEQLRLLAELSDEPTSTDRQPSPGPRSGSRTLTVRCPHCHQPIEVLADTPFTDLTCNGCGSHFSLAGDGQQTRGAETFKRLGHFELIERLGLGSFGTVWKARDTELDRTVAIKIPREGKLDEAETEQFLREARAAAQLNHPHIVTVHEVGREEKTVYIVSDLVRGLPLSDWLTRQQPTLQEAADLCAKVADALQYAHEAGVIHRDLKPQNFPHASRLAVV